jgi:hypothetical protein
VWRLLGIFSCDNGGQVAQKARGAASKKLVAE